MAQVYLVWVVSANGDEMLMAAALKRERAETLAVEISTNKSGHVFDDAGWDIVISEGALSKVWWPGKGNLNSEIVSGLNSHTDTAQPAACEECRVRTVLLFFTRVDSFGRRLWLCGKRHNNCRGGVQNY